MCEYVAITFFIFWAEKSKRKFAYKIDKVKREYVHGVFSRMGRAEILAVTQIVEFGLFSPDK